MEDADAIVVPEGWSCVSGNDSIYILSSGADAGFVTVDLKRRWWNLGVGYMPFSPSGCNSKGIIYEGRGWQQYLVNDAVAALILAARRR